MSMAAVALLKGDINDDLDPATEVKNKLSINHSIPFICLPLELLGLAGGGVITLDPMGAHAH